MNIDTEEKDVPISLMMWTIFIGTIVIAWFDGGTIREIGQTIFAHLLIFVLVGIILGGSFKKFE